jgi:hypothetical protein
MAKCEIVVITLIAANTNWKQMNIRANGVWKIAPIMFEKYVYSKLDSTFPLSLNYRASVPSSLPNNAIRSVDKTNCESFLQLDTWITRNQWCPSRPRCGSITQQGVGVVVGWGGSSHLPYCQNTCLLTQHRYKTQNKWTKEPAARLVTRRWTLAWHAPFLHPPLTCSVQVNDPAEPHTCIPLVHVMEHHNHHHHHLILPVFQLYFAVHPGLEVMRIKPSLTHTAWLYTRDASERKRQTYSHIS